MDIVRRCFVTRLAAARLPMVATVAAFLLVVPLGAVAQSAGRAYRVTVVWAVPPAACAPLQGIFEQRLRELGWSEGHILFERRCAELPANIAPLAEEAVKARPDVIVAATNRAIAAAARATSTIPIVMMYGHDPVGLGLALTIARPGKNVTGLTHDPGPELYAKQMELVKQLLPNADRVLAIRNAEGDTVPQARVIFRSTETAARALGLRLEVSGVRGAPDIERVFDQAGRVRPSAVFAVNDVVTYAHMPLIATLALKQRLPSVFWWREGVEAGGLASYGVNVKAAPRDAATFVDKILKGGKPSELPIEQPREFELVINVKTAKTLGLSIPQAVILRADQLIE
jgi:putative ABC transport system substrate-binding protein